MKPAGEGNAILGRAQRGVKHNLKDESQPLNRLRALLQNRAR